MAINKKHIFPELRVHCILDFFYLKISREHKIKKVNYKLFGIIPLVKTIQVENWASVYLFSCIQILSTMY
ncbi:hypothetical protein AGMMS50222_06180 [Endomicrobiia bacterium]|nr:hypothetical protein AGMMS49531_05010 [Endomicrobiia bacterium]GHT64451.1 hypothetical protein AGMMS49556_02570 [Endomicrobiia bacterium]GHT69981.1 hypothetical protein AGMMS49950_03890 [Endomicrobiia bacterium]GHT75363.1 hypothetical protein AGMMS50222_06180 [Endomicrobiia bacterium]